MKKLYSPPKFWIALIIFLLFLFWPTLLGSVLDLAATIYGYFRNYPLSFVAYLLGSYFVAWILAIGYRKLKHE